jgi:hypothetical protein
MASSEKLTPSPPGGGHTRWVERRWGVNSSEDARHCSVLYKCKYFVGTTYIKSSTSILGAVLRIRDICPGSRFFPIPDPTTTKKEGEKVN